jgi:hypothetical protein
MSRMRIALIALIAMAACGEPRAATPWAQEPSGIFGIAIGKPFPAPGEIADCPLFEPFRRENLPDDMCVDTRKGFSADAIALRYVPLGAVLGDANVELHDGLVRAIRVTFDRRRYAEAKALMFDRYGPSHSRVTDEPGETLAWTGTRVALTLRESADDRGHAVMEIRELSPNAAHR